MNVDLDLDMKELNKTIEKTKNRVLKEEHDKEMEVIRNKKLSPEEVGSLFKSKFNKKELPMDKLAQKLKDVATRHNKNKQSEAERLYMLNKAEEKRQRKQAKRAEQIRKAKEGQKHA